MTQSFPLTMEHGLAAGFVPSQKKAAAVPTHCAKLAEMSFAELLYYVVLSESKADA